MKYHTTQSRARHTSSQYHCEVASPSDIAGGDGVSGDGTVSAVELEAAVGGREYSVEADYEERAVFRVQDSPGSVGGCGSVEDEEL